MAKDNLKELIEYLKESKPINIGSVDISQTQSGGLTSGEVKKSKPGIKTLGNMWSKFTPLGALPKIEKLDTKSFKELKKYRGKESKQNKVWLEAQKDSEKLKSDIELFVSKKRTVDIEQKKFELFKDFQKSYIGNVIKQTSGNFAEVLFRSSPLGQLAGTIGQVLESFGVLNFRKLKDPEEKYALEQKKLDIKILELNNRINEINKKGSEGKDKTLGFNRIVDRTLSASSSATDATLNKLFSSNPELFGKKASKKRDNNFKTEQKDKKKLFSLLNSFKKQFDDNTQKTIDGIGVELAKEKEGAKGSKEKKGANLALAGVGAMVGIGSFFARMDQKKLAEGDLGGAVSSALMGEKTEVYKYKKNKEGGFDRQFAPDMKKIGLNMLSSVGMYSGLGAMTGNPNGAMIGALVGVGVEVFKFGWAVLEPILTDIKWGIIDGIDKIKFAINSVTITISKIVDTMMFGIDMAISEMRVGISKMLGPLGEKFYNQVRDTKTGRMVSDKTNQISGEQFLANKERNYGAKLDVYEVKDLYNDLINKGELEGAMKTIGKEDDAMVRAKVTKFYQEYDTAFDSAKKMDNLQMKKELEELKDKFEKGVTNEFKEAKDKEFSANNNFVTQNKINNGTELLKYFMIGSEAK